MRAQFSGLLLLSILTAAACADWEKQGTVLPYEEAIVIGDISYSYFQGYGIGEACSKNEECRNGLECKDGFCAAAGTIEAENPCVLSVECGDGLICGPDLENLEQPKTCIPEGDGGKWDVCSTDLDCQKGFYCKPVGFTGSCMPEGAGDMGADCETSDDCYAGLACSDGKCGLLGQDIPVFTGETCKPSSEDGEPPRVLFEVPRGGKALADFYRLPFPNNVRIPGKHLDLTGHPTPGDGVVGMDVARRVIDVAERDLSAFGTNPIVFFRFSVTPADPKSGISASGGTVNKGQNVFFLDITDKEDPDYGQTRGLNWLFSPGRQKYICQNHLAVYLPWSRPLEGDKTYAVILTNAINAEAKEEGGATRTYQQDADFAAMLASKAPGDTDLATAWTQYAPLRDFLAHAKAAEYGLTKENIIGATVFSTYDARGWMKELWKFLKPKGAPVMTELMLCDGTAKSPCDDGLTGTDHIRGCTPVSDKYYEFQGKLRVPVFQGGTKPFLEPADGGRIKMSNGMPLQIGVEEVCFALTVPKGTAPANGWPIVLYSHGTGGNYRSQIDEGVVSKLTSVAVWNSESSTYDRPVGFAVLGFDQVMHGPRKGDTGIDSDSLVFNFRNPQAALGNFLQGAADNISFSAFATALKVTIAPFSEATPLKMDPDNFFYMGHSQGGTTGPLYLPWAEEVKAAVLSGAGGGLVDSLLRKVAPVDIKDGVIMSLQDENVSRTHPVLALLQMLYEPVDPVNFGEAFFHTVETDMHPIRVLHIYGLEDMHTPPVTIRSLSQVMRADLAPSKTLPMAMFDEFSGVQVVTLPKVISRGITVEYKSDGTYTGHFVVFKNADAIRHYTNFLGTAVLDPKPTVVE